MTNELLVKIIGAVITIIIALVSAYVIPFVKSKIGESNFSMLLGYIDAGVRCAEQLYTVEQWKEKKQYVFDYTKGLIDKVVHIKLTDDEIDTLIEGMVNEVKHGGERMG